MSLQKEEPALDCLDLQLVSFAIDGDEITAELNFPHLLVQLRS
jgi:hypothetical protein